MENNSCNDNENSTSEESCATFDFGKVRFRTVTPTDIPRCYEIEKASYPADEAASKRTLQYRQHHAARFFRCAEMLLREDEEAEEAKLIGFITATRCFEFTSESMSLHQPNSPLLAIHSVVVDEPYRRKGLATSLLNNYLQSLPNNLGITKVVLLCKAHLLTFYLQHGFTCVGPSAIQHGSEQWYQMEQEQPDPQQRSFPYSVVDGFASVAGTGNPAAIVVLPDQHEQETSWMQMVAAEFNLSETAFVWQRKKQHEDTSNEETSNENTTNEWNIRYFTPTVEIPLCGHATLAASAVLYNSVYKATEQTEHTEEPIQPIVFYAAQDTLCTKLAQPPKSTSRHKSLKIAMEFPAKPAQELAPADQAQVQAMLESALGETVASNDILYMGYSTDIGDVLIELTPERFEQIGSHLNYKAFLDWDGYTRGVIVSCRSRPPDPEVDEEQQQQQQQQQVDFLLRFFAPKAGINEDPVTGSAFCILAPYFGSLLEKKVVVGKQCSQRSGIVECEVEDGTVQISGIALTSMSGTLWL